MPANAWAGLVVLGDGSVTPMAGGTPTSKSRLFVGVGLGAIAIAGALLLRRRFRRSEST